MSSASRDQTLERIYEMDAEVPDTELFERRRQQHEAMAAGFARVAAFIEVLKMIAAALALNVEGEAEDGADASRSAVPANEPASSGAMLSHGSADTVSVVPEPYQNASRRAGSMAGQGNDA